MKNIPAICCVLLVGALSVASKSYSQNVLERAKRDEVVIVADGDPAMAAAFKKAKASLDEFLALAKSPPPQLRTIAVKVAIKDKSQTEYFWIVPFKEASSGFTGQLNNEPRLVKTVSKGQEIQFAKQEIVDWMYIDTESKKMKGNFTACALLAKEPPEEAAKVKKQMGMECGG